MEMVATTKLRKFQSKAESARPYTEEIEALVRRLAAGADESMADGLFRAGPADAPRAILFVGSDRGLCGAYNSGVQRVLDQHIASLDVPCELFVLGRKAMTHATRRNHSVRAYFEGYPAEQASFQDAAGICASLVKEFRAGSFSAVDLCFTNFESMMRYVPTVQPFLPIVPPPEVDFSAEPILAPSAADLLGNLIPKYLETAVHHALLQSITSEYAARRVAMKNATEAAGDIKEDITRAFNRARQQKITSEILEIVSGAEAL